MRLARIALVALLVLIIMFSRTRPSTATTVGGRATTVTLNLVVGTTPVRVSVADGAMAKIGIRDEQVLGLTPSVGSEGTTLTIAETYVDPVTAEPRLREIGQIALTTGVLARFTGAIEPLDITLIQITAATPGMPSPNGPCTSCCVICQGIMTCGCAVETACGNCCCPLVCDCPNPSSSAGCINIPSSASRAGATTRR